MIEAHRFEIFDNEDWLQSIDIVGVNGSAIDLTGALLKMQVRDRRGRFALTLGPGNGLEISNATSGSVSVNAPLLRLGAMVPGVYRADIVMTVGDEKTNILQAIICVNRGVTTDDNVETSSELNENITISGGIF